MDPTVSFITLGVADIATSRTFYEALGLLAAPGSRDDVCFFQLSQGVVLALWSRELLARFTDRPVGAPTGTALSHNVSSDAEVDALLARVEAAGGRVTCGPEVNPGGAWWGWFLDPDGHAWEVVHNPRIRRDERGGVWLRGT